MKWLKNILVMLIGLLLGLLLAEGLLRLFYPIPKSHDVWKPGFEYVFVPDTAILAGIYDTSQFTINKWGMRGDEPNTDTGMIVCIGGSTTECLYLDDSETWPYLLQQKLNEQGGNYWVGNIGKSGLMSRHHIYHLKFTLEEHDEIDKVILMAGANDLVKYLAQGDEWQYYDYTLEEQEKRWRRHDLIDAAFTYRPLGTEREFVKKFAIGFLLRRIKVASRGYNDELIQDHFGNVYAKWRDHRSWNTGIVSELPDLSPALKEYRQNLQIMVDIAKEYSVELVLANQAYLWKDSLTAKEESLLWMGGIGNYQNVPNMEYYSPQALANGMQQFNKVTKEVAEANDLTFIDLDVKLEKSVSNFYDDMHFTEAGAAKVAEVIAAGL